MTDSDCPLFCCYLLKRTMTLLYVTVVSDMDPVLCFTIVFCLTTVSKANCHTGTFKFKPTVVFIYDKWHMLA